MSASMQETQDEIVEEFDIFFDQMDKYEYIIDLGKEMPPLDSEYKKEKYLVKGCQSKVWLNAYSKDGKVFFEADSNAMITKGIIALLIRVLSGHRADEILDSELEFIDRIDLRSHLSSQRSNGLTAMIKQMKMYAQAFQSQRVKSN